MQPRTHLSAAVAILAVAATASLAQDRPAPTDSAPGPTLACTNAGMTYQPGDFACIAACHGRRRLARCDTVADKASWTYVQETCPTSMINRPWPSAWSEVPVMTATSPIPVVIDRSAIPVDEKLAFADFGDKPAITQ
jgi:hypothetical protein